LILYVHLHRPSDRPPASVAAFHVLRVESGIPQRNRGLASHVKSIHAEHNHGIRFRQFTGPFLHVLRVAPDRALNDVLRAGDVVLRADIDDLNGLARIEHGLDLFDRDSR
jgi:hypothetical protein